MSRSGRRKMLVCEEVEPTISAALSDRVAQLIGVVRPSKGSEERRNRVAKYVRELIANCFAPEHKVEAFMFGSVPLRTYLPDGDIDVSIFCEGKGLQDCWGERLQAALEKEAENPKALFQIANVQLINAEVKLLKCLVDNIVVDMSFNQIGGLCTLNFLEAMDRRIGRQHLFKRSVILIKAWCYYESRVLGAQYSLLSTYALETMVLYIFNVHHEVLKTPLEVLYKFLVVFHQFEWDKYCLTLSGPVLLKNLEQDPSMPPSEQGTLLSAFMNVMLASYSYNPVVPTNTKGPAFPKFINIMDPLLHSNNLGRSVSKTSEVRIRNAFGYAAGKLTALFKKAEKDLPGALDDQDQFFKNTWNARCRPRPCVGPNPPSVVPASVPYHAPEEQVLEQNPKDAVENSSLGHPTAFPGFPGFQVGNTRSSAYLPQPPPPPPTRPVTEEPSRRNSNVAGLQAHPPPPPGPPPAQPILPNHSAISFNMVTRPTVGALVQGRAGAGIDVHNVLDIPALNNTGGVVQAGVGDAVIGRAVGQVDDRSTLVGVELSSGGVQLPGYDQMGSFNPWLMGQPFLVRVGNYYPVQPHAPPLQEVAGTNKSSAVQPGVVGPLIPARQEGMKGMMRAESAPNLGDYQQKRRDRNPNRQNLHPHPHPQSRKRVVAGEKEEFLTTSLEGGQPNSSKSTPFHRDAKSTGLILPNSMMRTSNRRTHEIRLDDDVVAKLKKMEVAAAKRREKQAAKDACGEQVVAATGLSSEPPPTPCEEPPDPASDSPKVAIGEAAPAVVVDQGRVQNAGCTNSEQQHQWHAAQGKQLDMGSIEKPDLNNLLQVGNLVSHRPIGGGNRGQIVNEQQQQQQQMQMQQMQAAVELGSAGDIHPGYNMYHGFYMPPLTSLQITQLCGAFGLTPQVPIPQAQRPLIAGRSIGAEQTKHNQADLMNQPAIISDFFSGGNYQPGNVVPVAYLNSHPTLPHNTGSTAGMLNLGEATAQAAGGSIYTPAPHTPVVQQSNPWGLINQGTGLHGQKASIDSHSDTVPRDQEDVLAGDLECLTKNLEVARNCVGKKSDWSKTSVTSRGGPTGRGNQRVDAMVTGGGHRKRHPPAEETRGFGIRTQGNSYEHRSGRSDRSQDRQHSNVYAQDGSSPNPLPPAYAPMMYVGAAAAHWAQPPPPPPAGVTDNQVVPLPTTEDILYQLQTNLPPHHEGGYYIQSSVGTPPVVTGAPVAAPGVLHALPMNPVHGVPAHMSATRRENQGNNRGHRSQWRGVDEGRHGKHLSVSTQDGTRVEIDPRVLRAVQSALAGTGTGRSPDVASCVNGPPDPDGQQPAYRDDHHRNPPADTQSPRSARSKSTDEGSGGSNGSQRTSVRKQSDGNHAQRPAGSDNLSLQNPPVLFGGVAHGSVDALNFLAPGGAQTVKGNGAVNVGFDSTSQMLPHGSSNRPNPAPHIPETNLYVGRNIHSYGTGGFIPVGAHFIDRQKSAGASGLPSGAANGGDPPGSRATPDGDPQSVPDVDHVDDGCWSSISAGSDRAEEARSQCHTNSRRYQNRYGRGSGGSKSYQHDYSRPPRYNRNQSSYWSGGGDHWYRGDRTAVIRDIPDCFPDCGQHFFYPDARIQSYAGGYHGGYIRQEQEFEPEVYASFDQQRHIHGGGSHGWKGGHRREKDDGRWYAYGHEEKNQTDGSSTPDSQGSHNTARSQNRAYVRRDVDRWDGNKRYNRGHRRMDEYSFVRTRRGVECHLEEDIVFHSGRPNGDHMFDRRTSHRSHHGGRSSHDRGHRAHHRQDDNNSRPFAFQDEDFPALESARPLKLSTPLSQVDSQHGTPKAGDLNPLR